MSVLIFITLKRSSREALSLTSKSSNTKAVSADRGHNLSAERKLQARLLSLPWPRQSMSGVIERTRMVYVYIF